MPKIKATGFGRKRALALFARGGSQEDVLEHLARRHPKNTPEEVRRAYFPKGGLFAIQSAQGASREQILKRIQKINSARQRFLRMRSDPIMAERVAKMASARMKEMMGKPEEKAAASERLRLKNKDPAFRANNKAAVGEGVRRKFREDKAFATAVSTRARKQMDILNTTRPELVKMGQKKGGRATAQKLASDPAFARVQSARSSQVMQRLNAQDPTFAKRASELAGAELKRLLREDKVFASKWAERARKTMLSLRTDKAFLEKMNEGILRYLRGRRAEIMAFQERLGISPGFERAKNFTRIAVVQDRAVEERERERVVSEAVLGLTQTEREVVYSMFGFENGSSATIHQTAELLSKPTAEVESLLKTAMAKLANNRAVVELV